jgi:hypothetical protein
MCETSRVAASHHAEVVVIDKIAGQLERGLTAPFDPSYRQKVASARSRILANYQERMGQHSWVGAVPLEQS